MSPDRFASPVARRLSALAGPRAAALALAALALVLRLPRLGESLWYDEVVYSTHLRFGSWGELAAALLRTNTAPLYRILLFGWTAAFGEHELVVRAPSLAFGVGSIALTYLLTRALAGPLPALLAGLFLCCTPAHVWYSQEATPYAMVTFLVVAASYAGVRAAAGARRPAAWLALHALALFAAIFTHWYAIFALPPLALGALGAPAPARRRLLGAQAAVAACWVAVFVAKSASGTLATGMGFLRAFTGFEAWMLWFHWFLHGNSLWTLSPYRASADDLVAHPALLAVQVAAAVCLARGVWRALRPQARRREAAVVAQLALLPAALWSATQLGFQYLYIERYTLFTLPFYALLLARGAAPAPGARRWRHAPALALVAASAAAWGAWLVQDEKWTVYKQNPDWRSAAAAILAREAEPSRVLVLEVTPVDGLAFQLRRLAGDRVPAIERAARFHARAAARRGVRRVFLAENLYWRGDAGRWVDRLAARRRLRAVGVHRFAGVRLHEYALR